MFTDPLADFLTRIRNASHARRGQLTAPSSRMLKAVAQVLKDRKFIEDFEEYAEGIRKELIITLRVDREPLELRRISRPGQRIYINNKDIKRVRNGLGIGIISTSLGILSDDEARRKKVGGEYLCEIF